jgi:saccharopine dehydrogenase-like NADP-dependent oxidoreductase
MNPITSEGFDIELISGQFPDDVCLIVGAGHFGKRAARILREASDSPILIVDKDKDRIEPIKALDTEKNELCLLARDLHRSNRGESGLTRGNDIG